MEAFERESFAPINATQLRRLLESKGLYFNAIGTDITSHVRRSAALGPLPELYLTDSEDHRLNGAWATELMTMTGTFAAYCWNGIRDEIAIIDALPPIPPSIEGTDVRANFLQHQGVVLKHFEAQYNRAVSQWARDLEKRLDQEPFKAHVKPRWERYASMLRHRAFVVENAGVIGSRSVTDAELISTHLQTGFGTALETMITVSALIVLIMGTNGVPMDAAALKASLRKNISFVKLLSQLSVQFIDVLSAKNRRIFLDLVCFTIDSDGLPLLGLHPTKFPKWLNGETISPGRHLSFTTCPANFSEALNGFVEEICNRINSSAESFFSNNRN